MSFEEKHAAIDEKIVHEVLNIISPEEVEFTLVGTLDNALKMDKLSVTLSSGTTPYEPSATLTDLLFESVTLFREKEDAWKEAWYKAEYSEDDDSWDVSAQYMFSE